MAAVALMVANMWWTVIEIDATPVYDVRTSMNTPPLSAAIEGDLTGILRQTDGYLFAWVRQQMRKGTGYYEAYAAARPATTPGTTGPTSVLNIREPLLYWAFAAAPNAWVIIGGLLALGTLTAVSSFVLLSDVVKLPVVLPAVAAILTFTVSIASTTTLLFAESWSGMLSLLVVVAVALSQRSPRWRTFVVVAAALALLAVLIREFAFFVVLAGLASSWFGAREERRFRTLVWGGALALAVVAYATHYVAALPHVVHAVAGANQEGFGLFKGGIGFALTAFAFDSHVFAYPFRVAEAVPYLLAALGVAGAVLLPTPQTRVVALGGIIPVFLAGLVAGNAAHMVGLTQSVNYWGIMMLFVVYACIPAVFSLMPAARVRRPPTRTESR
jgi:hypothetical protein